MCDCGCGIADSDCANGNADECERCAIGSCANTPAIDDQACFQNLLAIDNGNCDVPSQWNCAAEDYTAGIQNRCECERGDYDPDYQWQGIDPSVNPSNSSSCESCPEGSCAHDIEYAENGFCNLSLNYL